MLVSRVCLKGCYTAAMQELHQVLPLVTEILAPKQFTATLGGRATRPRISMRSQACRSDRQIKADFRAIHCNRGPKAAHIGVFKEKPVGQFLIILHVPGDTDENKIRVPGHVITLLDLRFVARAFAKNIQLVQGFPVKLDMHDEGHLVVKT